MCASVCMFLHAVCMCFLTVYSWVSLTLLVLCRSLLPSTYFWNNVYSILYVVLRQ